MAPRTSPRNRPPVIVRGGGDLGTGAALALRAAGWPVLVVDQPLPSALRLHVSFSFAAVQGAWQVSGVQAVHTKTVEGIAAALTSGQVPLWTGDWRVPGARFGLTALIDARLRGLTAADLRCEDAPLIIALGPGWIAGRHCHAVIETCRGERLGAIIHSGAASEHTGVPGVVQGLTHKRLLRSPCAGTLRRLRHPGDIVVVGETVATVAGAPVLARIGGLLRGLKLDGVSVGADHKVGDIDPRADRALLTQPTDKSTRIGAATLQALTTLLRQRTSSTLPGSVPCT